MHRAAGTAAVLFFFFLATGSWISHTSRFDGVASTFSFSVPPPALSPSTLARTRSLFSSRFFHRPEEPPSIVLPSETSFCFTLHSLPPSLSLFLSLSFSPPAYYIRAFYRSCTATIVFARASFEPDSLARATRRKERRRGGRCESGQTARRRERWK